MREAVRFAQGARCRGNDAYEDYTAEDGRRLHALVTRGRQEPSALWGNGFDQPSDGGCGLFDHAHVRTNLRPKVNCFGHFFWQ